MNTKLILNSIILSLFLISSVIVMGCNNSFETTPTGSNVNQAAITEETIYAFPNEDLNDEEAKSLVFMREEEKLARDVY